RDAAEVARRLQAAGVPAAPVLTPAQMYTDPQLTASGYYQAIEHPLTGVRRYPGWPFRDGGPQRTRLEHRQRSPLLGEHNEEVLRGLGMAPDAIAALRAAGVISEYMLGTEEEA